jgi:hypothetical protein
LNVGDYREEEEQGQGQGEEEKQASAGALEEDVPELTGPEMRQLLYTKYGKVRHSRMQHIQGNCFLFPVGQSATEMQRMLDAG